MSALTSHDVLRPGPGGLKRWTSALMRTATPVGFRLLRRFRPIFRFGTTYLVTRHDDVREVFGRDAAFKVPYQANLEVITGGGPFFLGMADTPEYQGQLAAMRRVFRADDLPALASAVEAQAQAIVQGSNGRIEVVDQLVRRVTFDVLADYIGVPPPHEGRLDVWRLDCSSFSSQARRTTTICARKPTRSPPPSVRTSTARSRAGRPREAVMTM